MLGIAAASWAGQTLLATCLCGCWVGPTSPCALAPRSSCPLSSTWTWTPHGTTKIHSGGTVSSQCALLARCHPTILGQGARNARSSCQRPRGPAPPSVPGLCSPSRVHQGHCLCCLCPVRMGHLQCRPVWGVASLASTWVRRGGASLSTNTRVVILSLVWPAGLGHWHGQLVWCAACAFRRVKHVVCGAGWHGCLVCTDAGLALFAGFDPSAALTVPLLLLTADSAADHDRRR